jgi:hypothetical protein
VNFDFICQKHHVVEIFSEFKLFDFTSKLFKRVKIRGKINTLMTSQNIFFSLHSILSKSNKWNFCWILPPFAILEINLYKLSFMIFVLGKNMASFRQIDKIIHRKTFFILCLKTCTIWYKQTDRKRGSQTNFFMFN